MTIDPFARLAIVVSAEMESQHHGAMSIPLMNSFLFEVSANCLVVTTTRAAHDGHLQTPSCSVARQHCRVALISHLTLRLVPTRDLPSEYFETTKAVFEDARAQVVITDKLFRFVSRFTKLVQRFVAEVLLRTFLKLHSRHQVFQGWCFMCLTNDHDVNIQ